MTAPVYLPGFLSKHRADELQQWLGAMNDWHQETFQLFGKTCPVPRRLCWFGDIGINYRYTGIDHRAEGWTTELAQLRDEVSGLCEAQALIKQPFNFLLINRYESGSDYMGWHRDDECACDRFIASLSVGATRRFRYEWSQGKRAQDLEHGSLLLFDGTIRHTLPKTRCPVATRFNLTFRNVQS